ncbi:pyruvate dehydrogenase [acetyl-transferring]-phosphatase 2, mitochondrial isoform X2 [Chrysoperla carnea]|uniref:pyruvate dehydrogenase [acetyl-transferring]-phosphatase 2, mitochondrial isoform X2 n=1 Tax=Chrysoperla carnea TaxID=189513 RepID=UPI001D064223|nr:pyruvate dehydrogenase [acetyl-transferring]-phosphatase 2, mitochondrial isoform X2 [Chrysoperla carnea]
MVVRNIQNITSSGKIVRNIQSRANLFGKKTHRPAFWNLFQLHDEQSQSQKSYSSLRCFYTTGTQYQALAKLSPQEVTTILRANEYTHDFTEVNSVKSYDSNQLASNNPIEDTRAEAACLMTEGLLMGVFDGHGGGSCAQVLAKRLFHYITASLLPPPLLQQYLQDLQDGKHTDLINSFNDKVQLVEDIAGVYKDSFLRFIHDLNNTPGQPNFEMKTVLENAFLRLDNDLSDEALRIDEKMTNIDDKTKLKTLSVAMSGAVACVAHIDGPHLHVANVGDCSAVLGVLSDTNVWIPKKLTIEHNYENTSEVKRIVNEHPPSEENTVIRMERLLGQLAPLRAMGDFRYKWSKEIMETVVAKHYGERAIPLHYLTPPYLSSKPDVSYHRLTPKDKFLVIASDGLWDLISPLQVVRLVGEHMSGKVTLSPLKLPRKDMTFNEINEMLLQRKEGLKMKPIDENAATHLIRNALGGTEYGLDHGKLSQLLTLPPDVVRVFRDDITITVIYFDSEYLRHCPM